LTRLASELTLAEQRERRRLAQVLHDHLQQLLVGAKFGLDVLGRRVGDDHQASVQEVVGLVDESIKASRSLTVELCPPILHEAGLDAALEWLARWMGEKYGLRVDLETDPRAATDREDVKVLLFQAVRELLFNVVKHARVITARVVMARHDDDSLRIVVGDEGAGFDPAAMWARAAQSVGGFGLFSIRERLALLGGRLEIASAAQKGATVTLIAPLGDPKKVRRAPPAPVHEPAASVDDVAAPAPAGGSSGRKIRVLLVDDHVVMRQGLSALLQEEADIEVVGEASDGKEGIEAARRLLPDVILMDFRMPRMNGAETTRVIHTQHPGVRIIGLSMYEEADRAAAMMKAGAAAYVTKSGRPEALLAAIRAAADARERNGD